MHSGTWMNKTLVYEFNYTGFPTYKWVQERLKTPEAISSSSFYKDMTLYGCTSSSRHADLFVHESDGIFRPQEMTMNMAFRAACCSREFFVKECKVVDAWTNALEGGKGDKTDQKGGK